MCAPRIRDAGLLSRKLFLPCWIFLYLLISQHISLAILQSPFSRLLLSTSTLDSVACFWPHCRFSGLPHNGDNQRLGESHSILDQLLRISWSMVRGLEFSVAVSDNMGPINGAVVN